MTKSFLAIKVTDKNLESAWISNPVLRHQYEIGRRDTCVHPALPFFIVSSDAVKSGCINTGCHFQKVMIVQVFTADLTHITPFNALSNFVSLKCEIDKAVETKLLVKINTVSYSFGALRVKPVSVIESNDYMSHSTNGDLVRKSLEQWSVKLKIPVLTIEKYLTINPTLVKRYLVN